MYGYLKVCIYSSPNYIYFQLNLYLATISAYPRMFLQGYIFIPWGRIISVSAHNSREGSVGEEKFGDDLYLNISLRRRVGPLAL